MSDHVGLGDLERLVAREEISALQARRARAVDQQDWNLYRTCHTEDFRSYTLQSADPNAENAGPDAAVEGLDAVVEGMVRALAGRRSFHSVTCPEIEFDSATTTRGIWRLEDRLEWREGDQDHWFHGWGFYHDTYTKRDGRWLFTSRRIERLHTKASPNAGRALS